MLQRKDPGIGEALVSLDQSKAFIRIDHQYPDFVHKAADFSPVFIGWFAGKYSVIVLMAKINGYL